MGNERTRLPDIHADAFVHDSDRAALEALRGVPGLDTVAKKWASGSIERKIHALRSRTSVRVGPQQYATIHRMVVEASEILDIEAPRTYISGHFSVNASAFGFEEYTLTLNAGLIDQMEDVQVLAVIGHELGHMLCDHMLYKSLAHVITQYGLAALSTMLGGFTSLLTVPLELALYNWSRAAEYSCDRAGLLVVQDAQVVASTLVKLAGGPRRLRQEFNLNAVREQHKDFEDNATVTERYYALLHDAYRTHPDPIWRANAILDWSENSQYKGILNGRYLRRAEVAQRREPPIEGLYACPACDRWVQKGRDCHHCGLRVDEACRTRCSRGHVVDVGWRFCRRCGERMVEAGEKLDR